MGKRRTPTTVGKPDIHFIAHTVVPGVVRHLERTGKSAAELDLPELPDMPSKTPEEIAASAEIRRMLEEMTRELRQENLNRAVRLAQMAARGVGPLVEHFQELGRRYAELADRGPPKPSLRVVKGGAD